MKQTGNRIFRLKEKFLDFRAMRRGAAGDGKVGVWLRRSFGGRFGRGSGHYLGRNLVSRFGLVLRPGRVGGWNGPLGQRFD